ncbi:MAG: L,D-transpeptidase [Bdellovibrio sp.]
MIRLISFIVFFSPAAFAQSWIGNLQHKNCPLLYKEPQGVILKESVVLDSWAVENCRDCADVYINSYFTSGVEKLRQFGLRDQDRAALYDYDNNCVFLIQTSGRKVNILASYGASGGRGGVSNILKSGSTSGGVHRTFLGAQEESRIRHSSLNMNLDPGKSGYIASSVLPTTGYQDWQTDFVLTRFIRLKGLEPELNSNSMERKILFHGTHEEGLLDYHESAGCIRMANYDILDFYQHLPLGSLVNVVSSSRKEKRHRIPRNKVIVYDETQHPGLKRAGR